MAIDGNALRSRRALLAGALGGMAALAAQAVGRPALVSGNDPNDVLLGGVNTATTVTSIENTTGDPNAANNAFIGKTSVQGAGVRGEGVSGANGVVGTTDFGIGVTGHASGAGGAGVVGTGGHTGVVAEGTENGVTARTPIIGNGVGLYAEGNRGASFRGLAAQIRLRPAGGTHPQSGIAGDIFLDSSKRLWMCKGGTSWVRIV